MSVRTWWLGSWIGRALSAVVAIKLVLAAAIWLLGDRQSLELLDRIANLALLIVAVLAFHQWTLQARGQLLWWVRRRLILSYVLVGAVPILLLSAFALLGFLLLFFDVSSYLVRNRLTAVTDQASTLARTTLVELDRSPFETRPEVLSRRHAVLETRYPGIELSMVPTTGVPRCGLAASKTLPPQPAGTLPRWVSCRGFAGMLLFASEPGTAGPLKLVARGAALPNRANPDYAVLVDLPVDQAGTAASLEGTGIQLGELTVVSGENTASPLAAQPKVIVPDPRTSSRSLFNTATFLTYTDWQTGLTGRAALSMSVQVGTLYRWLGGEANRSADVTFSRILLFTLVGIGGLLFVIEVIALANGLALARSITDAVDELFRGTERVKVGDYSKPIPQRTEDQLGQLASSFNDMTRSIKHAMEERAEKQRLEEELRIARDIQMSLLPLGPYSIPGVVLSGVCAPAREVGGDYYDYLPLEDGRLGLLIADV
ncbi:MAG TPA: HAMP domain-containing protein, partial [Steroidobacteraceae bacterium]|nr:HAMP domain-containing protein [Steroidobacteraceae bacterium]